jgi:hypothetical protein
MPEPSSLAVTTSHHVTNERVTHARNSAARWEAVFLERHEQPLRRLVAAYDAVIVFEQCRVRLADRFSEVAFHPGMAHHRVLRLRRGLDDPLVEMGQVQPGQRVVDATLGFGRDALVAAAAVGPTGKVVGLEASPALAAFADEGLHHCTHRPWSAAISVRRADAVEWLTQTDEEFHLAVLDPMFSRPRRAEPGFELLRRHAKSTPLNDVLLMSALNRARIVVVKVSDVAVLDGLAVRSEVFRRTNSAIWARFART